MPAKAEGLRTSITSVIGDNLRDVRPGSRRGDARQGGADRAGRVVAVPRGRHRAGRRDLHEGPADVGRRHRRGSRHPSEVGVEQPRAGSRARGRPLGPRGRAPRSATTSTCATSKDAARCCSARPRTTTRRARSARSFACSTSTSALDDVRACDLALHIEGPDGFAFTGAQLDVADQPRPARDRRAHDRSATISIPTA